MTSINVIIFVLKLWELADIQIVPPKYFSLGLLSTATFILRHDRITLRKLNIDQILLANVQSIFKCSPLSHDVSFVSFEGYFLRPETPRDWKRSLALISVHVRTRSALCHEELIFHESPQTAQVTPCKETFRTSWPKSIGIFNSSNTQVTNLLWLKHWPPSASMPSGPSAAQSHHFLPLRSPPSLFSHPPHPPHPPEMGAVLPLYFHCSRFI